MFDLDGTLIDSRRDIADAANALLEESGRHRLQEEKIGQMVGDGAATLVARAFAATGAEAPPGALDRFLSIYEAHLLDHTREYPGISEVLTSLTGRAALAVLTNKPLRATRQILDGLGLAGYFDPELIVGGDGPWPRKPDPGGLTHLMRAAPAIPAATVVVGDSFIDSRTARAASTSFCLARYGFGSLGFPPSEVGLSVLAVDEPKRLVHIL